MLIVSLVVFVQTLGMHELVVTMRAHLDEILEKPRRVRSQWRSGWPCYNCVE
jgi:hypothetical protein